MKYAAPGRERHPDAEPAEQAVQAKEDELEPSPPKIYLTGKIGAGKSTIVTALISALKVPVGGFVTERVFEASGEPSGAGRSAAHRGEPRSAARRNGRPSVGRHDELRIAGFVIRGLATGKTGPIADFDEDGTLRPRPEGFETVGVEALRSPPLDAPAGAARLIVMDEIGFLESGSPRFQEAVFETIRGPLPVLGVLKEMCDSENGHGHLGPNDCASSSSSLRRRGRFLETVKTSGVRLLRVTEENRSAVEEEAFELLSDWFTAHPS